ncbi:uncharacterized protein LOC125492775 [Beta vulgaris subsp. vulgaris]|uniref:uncharacterized protein LOC125492775 n=1 Tax=Beta vulgaris subsp. vulgaris TaxID=3555 RepID=UPI00254777F2|nr:uncharacterized protein LOC125492775 [Beta vulgaris subsp. vulgaris]
MMAVKKAMKDLHSRSFSNAWQKADEYRQKLTCLQTHPDIQHNDQLQMEERETSRIDWLTQGDTSSRLFFTAAKVRKAKNNIILLYSEQGVLLTKPEEIQGELVEFYRNLLGSAAPMLQAIDLQTVRTGPRLSTATSLRAYHSLVSKICTAVEKFSAASGLHVSPEKSNIYLAGVSPEEAANLAESGIKGIVEAVKEYACVGRAYFEKEAVGKGSAADILCNILRNIGDVPPPGFEDVSPPPSKDCPPPNKSTPADAPISLKKNAPTSKALAEKAAAKKAAGTSEAPPSKKAKGFTAKKRKTTRPVPKVVIELPAKEEAKEEPAEADSRALVAYTGPAEQPTPSQPDEVVILEDAGQSSQPDTAVDGSAFSGPVAQLVGQMPAAYRTASRSSDKGKGPAVDGSPSLSDDESSPAFGKMSSSDREKLKTELFKCFPEPYIKGLRGASSGHVGYMSQLAAELFARSMITEDWAKELRKENKKLVHDVTAAADHAQFAMAQQEVLHQQTKVALEKRSAELESQIKVYLLRLTEMLDERASLERVLTDERNSVMTMAADFFKENLVLKVKNQALRTEVAETIAGAKEAMNTVIDTSKEWALQAFGMMAEEEDIPRYARRLAFQEALHKATISGADPPVFEESSEDEEGRTMLRPRMKRTMILLPLSSFVVLGREPFVIFLLLYLDEF